MTEHTITVNVLWQYVQDNFPYRRFTSDGIHVFFRETQFPHILRLAVVQESPDTDGLIGTLEFPVIAHLTDAMDLCSKTMRYETVGWVDSTTVSHIMLNVADTIDRGFEYFHRDTTRLVVVK